MHVPIFPDFRDIQLTDKELITSYFHAYPPIISEYTFTNLFIWRNKYRFKICLLKDCLCLLANPIDGSPFFFPPIGKRESLKHCLHVLFSYLEESGYVEMMRRVPEELIIQHVVDDPNFQYELDRDNCDYVYLCSDLIGLKGRKYDGKRNFIRNFKERFPYKYAPLTKELAKECLDFEAKWCNIKHCELYPNLLAEEKAIFEALNNFEYLDAKGGAVLINDHIEAFTLGEKLNSDSAVIHVEKANPEYEGSYQFINQQFCETEWSDCKYINREQDLGEKGLRRAKLSYHPNHMVRKYTIRFRKR